MFRLVEDNIETYEEYQYNSNSKLFCLFNNFVEICRQLDYRIRILECDISNLERRMGAIETCYITSPVNEETD